MSKNTDVCIERSLPIVAQNGLNTNKAVDFSGASTVALGPTAVTGALTVSTTADITGVSTLTGGAAIGAKVITSGTETIAAGGTTTALDLTKTVHYIDADAGGDIFTLAAGTVGQIMVVLMKSATGIATVTPVAMAGGTSVTLNAIGESVIFQYMDSKWFMIGGNAYTVI